MPSTALRHAIPVALAVFSLSASAENKSRLVLLDLNPLDPEVSRAVCSQLTSTLEAQLGEQFALVPAAEVDRVRSGVEDPPDVSNPVSILAQAKEQLSVGNNREALKLIKQAHAILDPLKPQLRDYTPLTQAFLYAGVASMQLKDKKGEALAFEQLARLRPAFQINPAEFPPNVLEAFEKVRAKEIKAARGRIALSSNPPGAKAFIDEVQVGVTPITVPQSPGEHLVRIEQPGYLNWTKTLNVESYAKADVQAALEKNGTSEALISLETDTVKGKPPGSFNASAQKVAGALHANGVIAGIVALGINGYIASVAYLPAGGGSTQVAVIELDRSLKDKNESLTKLSAALASAARSKGGAGEAKTQAQVLGAGASRKVDFGAYAFGFGPGGSAQVMADAEAQREALNLRATAGPAKEKPTRWWLWAGGGVVVAAAAAGTAAFFLTRKGPNVQFELDRQP